MQLFRGGILSTKHPMDDRKRYSDTLNSQVTNYLFCRLAANYEYLLCTQWWNIFDRFVRNPTTTSGPGSSRRSSRSDISSLGRRSGAAQDTGRPNPTPPRATSWRCFTSLKRWPWHHRLLVLPFNSYLSLCHTNNYQLFTEDNLQDKLETICMTANTGVNQSVFHFFKDTTI